MNVADLGRTLLRRRVFTAAAVVVALLAGVLAWSAAQSSRQSTATVVIVPPRVSDDAAGRNPLLNLSNNLAQLATVLASALQSGPVNDALAAGGNTASYTVSNVTSNNPSFAQLSPELQFTTSARSGAVTQRTAEALVAQATTQLDVLQRKTAVPAGSRATIVEVAAAGPGSVVGSGRLRAAGAVGIVVLVLGLVLVLLGDALLPLYRRRRAAARTDTKSESAHDLGDPAPSWLVDSPKADTAKADADGVESAADGPVSANVDAKQ